MWEISGEKLIAIEDRLAQSEDEALVYTRNGRYTSRGWTDWTRGFQVGSMLLQAEAEKLELFLPMGARNHNRTHTESSDALWCP